MVVVVFSGALEVVGGDVVDKGTLDVVCVVVGVVLGVVVGVVVGVVDGVVGCVG